MANRKSSEIDQLRTKIWATMVRVAAGGLPPTRLEEDLKQRREAKSGGRETKEATGIWQRYLKGEAKPFKTWEPRPQTVWVDECEEFFPERLPGFSAPFGTFSKTWSTFLAKFLSV